MKTTLATFTVTALIAGAAQAGPVLVFSEDFEAPDVSAANSTGNTSGAVAPDWVRATQGFGAGRNGLVDESSGQFTDPTGEQAHAFRYTNSGLTSKEAKIGNLTAGSTYTVKFDVVKDGGGANGLPYVADLMAWNPGARRDDVRNNSFGTILAGTTGNAEGDGSYKTITFSFTADAVDDAAVLGRDVTLRFKGASNSANIDNVEVWVDSGVVIPTPSAIGGSLALLGMLVATRRRRG